MENFLSPFGILFCATVLIITASLFLFRNKIKSSGNLLQGSIIRGLFSYNVPIMMGILFQQFYNLVDSIVVGKILGINALAAVNIAGSFMWFNLSIFWGIALGAGVIIARYYGKNDPVQLRLVVHTAFSLFTLMGIAISLIGYFVAEPVYHLMKTPEPVLILARDYTQVFFSGFIVFALYNIASGVLSGTGDSSTPFFFMVLSTILNIVLDILMVAYLGWGVKGAAFATVLSQTVCMAGCMIYLYFHKNEALRFRIKDLTLNKQIIADILKNGIPMSLQQTTQSFGFLLQAGLISSFGPTALAAYGAISRIDNLLLLPGYSFSSSMSTYISQNIGASQLDRCKKGVYAGIFLVVISTLILIIPAYFFRETLIKIFVKTEEIETIAIGVKYFEMAIWGYPFTCLTFMFSGVFRGSDRSILSFSIGLIALWVVRLPLAYFLSLKTPMGLDGVWFASPIHWLVATVVSLIIFFSIDLYNEKKKPSFT